MSTEPTVVGDGRLEKRVVVDRVGNSIRVRRSGVPDGGEVLVPLGDVEELAAVMQGLAE